MVTPKSVGYFDITILKECANLIATNSGAMRSLFLLYFLFNAT